MRIGHGFDVHAFKGKGPILIGGICIPYARGILAHSDGDVLLHALIDALLGASAFGDIGTFFPNTNKNYKNMSSKKLLNFIWDKIQNKKYKIGNIDITVIAQEPNILPYIQKIRTFISKELNCCIEDINVKATTTEKLGFIGRIEGIACEAVLLLISKSKI